ncbi:B12-binding domain-containing radical SAM protein [Calderihabitans maritimus]|uniref:Radical SAM protein n=1 Tax=Calderihabitans maritimus TaxID=1246530 RepID=A0A1Z5HW70_9FIRM|nr:cobalamin-dependent protein [Calderihabitans maritimus]GAW93597.1 radical SAM protein [Calderihabitans maritimus]
MARVMLVTPDYHCGVVESAGRWPHLGFVYIAGELRKAGHEVKIYDAMSKGHRLEQIIYNIRNYGPQVVGTTAYTASFPAATELLRRVKEIDPQIITVIGGVHATFCYKEVLEGHPSIDYVVRGEGEYTLPHLLEVLESGGNPAEVPGVALRRGNEVLVTPDRGFIQNLDELTPAWDLLDWEDYTFYVYPGSRLAIISTSRGCKHTCKFCSQQKFWRQTWRARSPGNVLTEIEYLVKEYGVDIFFIADEYPTADRERWENILDGLISKKLNALFLIETRVDDIIRDEDIIDKYRRAGIIHIYVGIEATSQGILDKFSKGIQESDSKRALDIIHRAGIVSETSFVLGTPDETPESIKQTLAMAKAYNPDFAHFLLLAPWPYADMYEEVKNYVATYDYAKYNLVEPVIKPEAMTTDELFQKVLECYRSFYFGKIPEWTSLKNEFKRRYAIQCMRAIMDNSFLQKHVLSLGRMPKMVRDLLKLLD